VFIAFYLPQFYPTPENDQWWGPGFTDWVNVSRARPRFRGHYQPHVPADLGFYDLRDVDTRQKQAQLALDNGIDAFCYYHYWFNGRRLLNLPLDEMCRTGTPSMPFCLCWANENWTRSWDGSSNSILVQQSYSESDDHAHGRWLAEVFSDQRYVRVDGRPLFLVYRASQLPNPQRTTEIWRGEAERAGVSEPFLCRVESFASEHDDPRRLGFDAAVEFQPDWTLVPPGWFGLTTGLMRRFGLKLADRRHVRMPYEELVNRAAAKSTQPFIRFPCVTPSWDNTPRRKTGAFTLTGSTPSQYGRWVELVDGSNPYSLAFVNAWNEWGEGCHLEPCQRWGRQYLEAHLASVGIREGA